MSDDQGAKDSPKTERADQAAAPLRPYDAGRRQRLGGVAPRERLDLQLRRGPGRFDDLF